MFEKQLLLGARAPRPQRAAGAQFFRGSCLANSFSRFALIAGEGARAPSVPVSGLDHEEADDQAKQSRA